MSIRKEKAIWIGRQSLTMLTEWWGLKVERAWKPTTQQKEPFIYAAFIKHDSSEVWYVFINTDTLFYGSQNHLVWICSQSYPPPPYITVKAITEFPRKPHLDVWAAQKKKIPKLNELWLQQEHHLFINPLTYLWKLPVIQDRSKPADMTEEKIMSFSWLHCWQTRSSDKEEM